MFGMSQLCDDHFPVVVFFCCCCCFRYVLYDIDGLAGEEEEMSKLVQRLNKAFTTYGMQISAEKTKLVTNNTSGINTEIKVNGQKLETVTSFKYLGSFITDLVPSPRYSPG